MKCPECSESFTPLTVVQKYCSKRCGDKWRRKHKGVVLNPSIEFNCAQCGKKVVTDGLKDKRSRFCSQKCEKKFWRHPHWESESNRINFRSVDEYARWEAKTNE